MIHPKCWGCGNEIAFLQTSEKKRNKKMIICSEVCLKIFLETFFKQKKQ